MKKGKRSDPMSSRPPEPDPIDVAMARQALDATMGLNAVVTGEPRPGPPSEAPPEPDAGVRAPFSGVAPFDVPGTVAGEQSRWGAFSTHFTPGPPQSSRLAVPIDLGASGEVGQPSGAPSESNGFTYSPEDRERRRCPVDGTPTALGDRCTVCGTVMA